MLLSPPLPHHPLRPFEIDQSPEMLPSPPPTLPPSKFEEASSAPIELQEEVVQQPAHEISRKHRRHLLSSRKKLSSS
ncbi:hypothetical protein CRG98_043835 [Punica granatum]|uniref:Uncharacterized protein n=1 Tax=Punica granatum TaxID=22663 RepID=A0A2I0HWB0_PUNGR|nr:hypothetical protein CRG98_043835 [Punica granatum]